MVDPAQESIYEVARYALDEPQLAHNAGPKLAFETVTCDTWLPTDTAAVRHFFRRLFAAAGKERY